MSRREHSYDVTVTWTGNHGEGTASYTAYGREHEITSSATTPIAGSADPAFRGDADRWNPEQLQVVSLSQCHMLWYLNLAASAGVTVVAYEDAAHGVMTQNPDGSGQFESVTLRPVVTITDDSDADVARRCHADVPRMCFIARSVNFPVHHEPVIRRESDASDD